jgi:ferric-dicitrate binding protein FerR (iron transport regulator)
MPGERLPEEIVRMAIEWQMRLRADGAQVDLLDQVKHWRRSDARHELAWQRLQQLGGMFSADKLPDAAQALPVLRRAETDVNRRRMLKLLGLGLVAGSATLLTATSSPGWRSDFATGTGERRRIDLGAGTQVMLNTGSALDVSGNELVLRSGEALVEGDDWRVRCRFVECRGRGARAVLREHDGYSEIHVDRGEAVITSASGVMRLPAGSGLAIDVAGTNVLQKGPLDPFAWTRGLLLVSDIRLVDFLAEAGRYRHGWLGCDDAVANLRLSGVFHLDEPAVMLRNITHLLPVGIVERTRWWVRVVPLA